MTNYAQARVALLWRGLLALVFLAVLIYPFVGGIGLITESLQTIDNRSLMEIEYREGTRAKPKPFKQPIVTIAFDDGWVSVYNEAIPVVERFGYKSSQYILTGQFDDPNYLSKEQVDELYDNGHHIGSHTVSHAHLTEVDSNRLFAELTDSKLRIRDYFGLTEDFAWPFGEYNDETIAEAKKYYRTLRTTDGGINTAENFDRYRIRSLSVTNDIPLSDIKALINETKITNGWLILTYHGFGGEPGIYTLEPDQLKQHLRAIRDANVGVYTLDQVIDEIL